MTQQNGIKKREKSEKVLLLVTQHQQPQLFCPQWSCPDYNRLGIRCFRSSQQTIYCRAMAITEVQCPVLGSPMHLMVLKVIDLLLTLRLRVQMRSLLLFNYQDAAASCLCLS